VLLGALYRARAASRGGEGEESVVTVSSLEFASRGRGNGGVVLLPKGKWRRCSAGHGGGATAAGRMGGGGAASD
jgi:hypothetical protein